MREARVVINMAGQAFYWGQPDGRTSVSLPDDHDFWMVLWDNRHQLSGVAHSHPGGMATPSYVDLTTFAAIEAGLGRRLDWWILAGDILIHSHWIGPGRLSYESLPVEQRPTWVSGLREASQT
jgi:proteasome lid subunit RPN8/RPN11